MSSCPVLSSHFMADERFGRGLSRRRGLRTSSLTMSPRSTPFVRSLKAFLRILLFVSMIPSSIFPTEDEADDLAS